MNRTGSSGRLSGLCLLPSREMETSTANSAHCLSKSQPPHPPAACSVTPLDPLPGLAQSRHCVQALKGTSEGQRIARPPLFGRRSGGGGVRGRGCGLFSVAAWCCNVCGERQGSRDPVRGLILRLHVPNPPETRSQSQRPRERRAGDKCLSAPPTHTFFFGASTQCALPHELLTRVTCTRTHAKRKI